MKHLKWYTWIGMVLLFIIITMTFVKVLSTINQKAHTETMTVEVESKEVDHLIQMETETKQAGSLTSVKSIPFTQIKPIDQPIKQWANQQEEDFFTKMTQAEVLLDHQASAHFSLESEVIPLTEALYHVAIVSEQAVDQQDSYTKMKTFTIDLDNNKLVGLEKITTKKLTMGKLLNLLSEHSDEDMDYKKFHEQYDEKTFESIDWTVGENNIVFYLKPGIISSTDDSKVVIPLMDFYPYIQDNYYSSLISEELDKKIKQKEKRERQKRAKEEQDKREALQEKKLVALTFDDGPHPIQTVKILHTLDQYNATATFFAIGNNVKQHPDVVKRIVKDGHELANHSMSHANLNAVKQEKTKKEIFDAKTTIKNITGKKPTLFRPPYGNFEDNIATMIAESNQDIVLWSIDTHDWEHKNAKAIYQTVKAHTVPGSIILMHDIYPTTADTLPKILEYYKKKGYQTVTVSELIPYIEDTNKNGAYFGH